MAELIQKVENGYDHDAHPLQHKLSHLGISVDMAAFHRNREINRNSSFSVARAKMPTLIATHQLKKSRSISMFMTYL